MLKRILLIEQSATLRHVAKKLIDRNEYEVVEFSNYAEVLAHITSQGAKTSA